MLNPSIFSCNRLGALHHFTWIVFIFGWKTSLVNLKSIGSPISYVTVASLYLTDVVDTGNDHVLSRHLLRDNI